MTIKLAAPPKDGAIVESAEPVRMPHHPKGAPTAIRRGVVESVYDARQSDGDDFYIVYWTPVGSLQMIGTVVAPNTPRPLRVLGAGENGRV